MKNIELKVNSITMTLSIDDAATLINKISSDQEIKPAGDFHLKLREWNIAEIKSAIEKGAILYQADTRSKKESLSDLLKYIEKQLLSMPR